MCQHHRAVRTRFATTFDHEGLVANAGLILAGTLMARLGLFGADRAVGAHRFREPGPQDPAPWSPRCSQGPLISIMSGCCAPGAPGGCWDSSPMRALDGRDVLADVHVRSCPPARSGAVAHARSRMADWEQARADAPLVVDLDSTICEVHGKQKQGAAYGYTKELGYHPLLATRADTGEVLGARMRKGSAGSSRGVVRFVDELVANLRRAGAAGPTTVRADSGFWSRKLIDRLDAHDIKWSITVALRSAVRAAIQAISAGTAWTDIDYTKGGHAQVAETEYTTGRGQSEAHRSPRGAPHPPHRGRPTTTVARLATPRIHHQHRNSTPPPRTSSTAPTPSSSSPSATSKKAPDSNTSPQATTARTAHGSPAQCSPTTSATGPTALAGAPPATNRSRRTRLVALAAVLVNRSGTPTLRYPARWPWETQFTSHTQRSAGLCPDPPAKRHSPELTPPHKPSVDNPKPHPHP